MSKIPLRHFEPEDPPSLSLAAVAVDLASKGWPVVPGRQRTKRPYRKNLRGSTDAAVVAQHWLRDPNHNPLIDLGPGTMVVLDVDDERAEEWLRRAASELGDLPPTLEVRTRRGRHLWFRLADDCPPLVSQGGGDGGAHPGLDVKFSGVVAAPGAVHPLGGRYAPVSDVPEVSALPVLPRRWYDRLRAVGRLRGEPLTKKRPKVTTHVAHEARALPVVHGWLGQVLNDTSDGRDRRTLVAVGGLVRLGLSDADVKATVLAYPLGGKALEQSSPDRYLQGKIDWCRDRADHTVSGWNPHAYWQAARASGLTSTNLKVLLALLRRARRTGRVSRSLDLIGIDSATSPSGVSTAVTSLVASGWLAISDDPPRHRRIPRTYLLTIPEAAGQVLNSTAATTLPPPPAVDAVGVQFLSRVVHHDAFRPGEGSLHSCFPLLALLGFSPGTPGQLATLMGKSEKTVTRRLAPLMAAGLAKSTDQGVVLVPSTAGLAAVARAAGTLGARRAAIAAYEAKKKADREAYRLFVEQATTPGTARWLAATRQYYDKAVRAEAFEGLVRCWREDGMTEDDLVAYLVDADAARHSTTNDNTIVALIEAVA